MTEGENESKDLPARVLQVAILLLVVSLWVPRNRMHRTGLCIDGCSDNERLLPSCNRLTVGGSDSRAVTAQTELVSGFHPEIEEASRLSNCVSTVARRHVNI